MQTSPTAMLDFVTNRLLNNRQTDTSSTSNTSNDALESRQPPPEAEVRLVVKFIVEEHIVYRGKVEKINQLEKEELSRVVSRVAWNDAGTKERLNPDSIESKLDEASDSTQFDIRVESNSRELSASHAIDHIAKSPHDEKDLIADSKRGTQEEQTPGTIKESPNHDAFIKDTLSDHEAEEDTTAQTLAPRIQRSQSSSECDKDPTLTFLDARNMDEETLLNKSDDCASVSRDNGRSDDSDDIKTNSIQIEEAYAEKLSIANLLNDCIDDIDCESHHESYIDTCSSPATISDKPIDLDEDHTTKSFTPDTITIGSEEQEDVPLDSKENGKDANYSRRSTLVDNDVAKIISENSANKINDIERALGSSMYEKCTQDEIVQTLETPEMSEFTPASTPIILTPSRENDTGSSSNKRKSSSDRHTTSGKRVRRTSSKEKNTRNITSRSADNLTRQNNVNASKLAPSTISLLANSQPYRQNKVFAKWSDNHFYPGTILKPAKDRKLVIVFFDGAQRNVPEADLIPLDSIEGKQVRVSIAKNYCVNAIVHDQRSSSNDQPMFDVEYQQDGIVRKCVPLKDIFLTAEQGTPLINQIDRTSGASNFADVDLDNIIYEKRSRRIQEMEEFYLTSTSPHRTKTSLLL